MSETADPDDLDDLEQTGFANSDDPENLEQTRLEEKFP